MDLKATFASHLPDAIFLEHQVSDELTHYLRQQQWIDSTETVRSVEKPGEGNMNFVARVTTDSRSFIVKQALPWVYKYPQVAAPLTRGQMEADFYQLIQHDAVLQQSTPAFIGFDTRSYVLALNDLGAAADFTFLYQSREAMSQSQLRDLLLFLSHLHQIQATPGEDNYLENREMRVLNHHHIFQFPYVEENGMDLDAVLPGLKKVALPYQRNTTLKNQVAELGELYLQDDNTLIHGDYYPGSWMQASSGIKVIDPEFGFFGKPEFDVGVMMAHALIIGISPYTPTEVLDNYQASDTFDASLAKAFAGAEVLRRLLGLAQLPLTHTLEQREGLLQQAAAMI